MIQILRKNWFDLIHKRRFMAVEKKIHTLIFKDPIFFCQFWQKFHKFSNFSFFSKILIIWKYCIYFYLKFFNF